MISEESTSQKESESMSNFNDVSNFYKTLLRLFGERRYDHAESYFYSRIGFFRRFFDRRFYLRSAINTLRPQHRHRKFLKDLYEFGRCIKRNQSKKIEYEPGIVEVGFGKLLDFNSLKRIHNENLILRGMDLDYFYHYCILISGSWTEEFTKEILEIYVSDATSSDKYYLLTSLLEKSMYETSTYKKEFIELNVQPRDPNEVPRDLSELLKYRKEQESKNGNN